MRSEIVNGINVGAGKRMSNSSDSSSSSSSSKKKRSSPASPTIVRDDDEVIVPETQSEPKRTHVDGESSLDSKHDGQDDNESRWFTCNTELEFPLRAMSEYTEACDTS